MTRISIRDGVVVGAADVEVEDFVRRLELDDLVEDGGQQARVDQVAFGLDRVARRHPIIVVVWKG